MIPYLKKQNSLTAVFFVRNYESLKKVTTFSKCCENCQLVILSPVTESFRNAGAIQTKRKTREFLPADLHQRRARGSSINRKNDKERNLGTS